jgi:hypothetical protein
LVNRETKKWFFAIFAESEHFRAYVASQHYINAAIAHISVCWNSLYDLQGQSYKNQLGAKPSKVGVVKNGRYPEIQKWYEVQICSSWSKIPYPVVRLLLTKNASGITLHTGLILPRT